MAGKEKKGRKKKSTRLTIEEEEKLAHHVKMYPCLFDKTDKGFKERDCTANSWQQVASALEFVDDGM